MTSQSASTRRAGRFLYLFVLATAIAVFGAGAAYAANGNFDDGNTTITTSFTREPSEAYCGSSSGCYFDAHFPLTTCSKTASSRLRFQRDAQPDATVREKDNFTSCTNYYWDNYRSQDNHGHHMDGAVTSGTGAEHFFYTDTH